MKTVLAIALVLLTSPALCEDACDVPVVEWQPRETLRSLLEAKGWQVSSITAEDGCYEATGTDKTGHPIAVSFNPKTLQQIGDPHQPNRS